VFYVIKFVLDWKIVYILLVTENIKGICHLEKNTNVGFFLTQYNSVNAKKIAFLVIENTLIV
jgi:hypothetical protein